MYHYTESGLQNVYLENGVIERKTSHGPVTSIPDVDGLNRVIGRALASKTHLTGAEFRYLRKQLGLSQHGIADLIGSTEQTVALWERHGKVPKTASRMLRALYLETLDGSVKLRELIERDNDLERKEGERLVLRYTKAGWFVGETERAHA